MSLNISEIEKVGVRFLLEIKSQTPMTIITDLCPGFGHKINCPRKILQYSSLLEIFPQTEEMAQIR